LTLIHAYFARMPAAAGRLLLETASHCFKREESEDARVLFRVWYLTTVLKRKAHFDAFQSININQYQYYFINS